MTLTPEEKRKIDKRIKRQAKSTGREVPYFVHEILKDFTEEKSEGVQVGHGWYWAKEDKDSDIEIVGVTSTGKVRRLGREEVYRRADMILLDRIDVVEGLKKKAREYLEKREERAEEESMKIEEIEEFLFRVKGEYIVEIDEGTCTCPDFEFRGNKCKHILAVERYIEE